LVLLLGLPIARADTVEQPLPWEFGMQAAASPVREPIDALHDEILGIITRIQSFKLMYYMDHTQHANMTLKVTGHQWYWSYEYPDKDLAFGFDSNVLPDDQA